MSDKDQNKKDAAEHAARAARQMKHAANNAGEATEAAAEYAKDEVVDGVVEAKTKAQNFFKDAALRAVYSELGQGALMLSVGIAFAGFGTQKVRRGLVMRRVLLENLAKADHHIRPEG